MAKLTVNVAWQSEQFSKSRMDTYTITTQEVSLVGLVNAFNRREGEERFTPVALHIIGVAHTLIMSYKEEHGDKSWQGFVVVTFNYRGAKK